MTTTASISPIWGAGQLSRLAAEEIRVLMTRQNVPQTELARRVGRPQAWVSRRIGAGATTDMTLEEMAQMSESLGVSAQAFLSLLLPRLDSNQQPSGYPSSQVGDHDPEPLGPPERPHARVLMFRGRP